MNYSAQHIIAALEDKYGPFGGMIPSVASRFNDPASLQVQWKKQLCLTVANVHANAGDLRDVETWINNNFQDNFRDKILTAPYPFNDFVKLENAFQGLVKHYNIITDVQRHLRDLDANRTMYIVAIIIPIPTLGHEILPDYLKQG